MNKLDALSDRLAREAARLRREADTTPAGLDRDALLIRAKRIEQAASVYRAIRTPN
jgi:hypothetical protein